MSPLDFDGREFLGIACVNHVDEVGGEMKFGLATRCVALSPYLSEADIYSRIMYIELDVLVVIIGVFFCVMIDAGALRTLNGA